jgi:hypothetical protein
MVMGALAEKRALEMIMVSPTAYFFLSVVIVGSESAVVVTEKAFGPRSDAKGGGVPEKPHGRGSSRSWWNQEGSQSAVPGALKRCSGREIRFNRAGRGYTVGIWDAKMEILD